MAAKAHYVKKARKDNPAVKKGSPYWWWQFFKMPKRYSATKPTRSQLTRSAFWSEVYDIEDAGLCACEHPDDLQDLLDRIDDLVSQTQDSYDNMPEQLQGADVGELLQERIDGLESWKNEIESIKDSYEDLDRDDEEAVQSFIDEISSCCFEG